MSIVAVAAVHTSGRILHAVPKTATGTAVASIGSTASTGSTGSNRY